MRPLAIYQVCKVYREVCKKAGVPIIGMGGIQYWQDAAEFVLAGATGLAVGTALFVDPATPNNVLDGLKAWLKQIGAKSLSEVVGTVQLPGDPPPAPYP